MTTTSELESDDRRSSIDLTGKAWLDALSINFLINA